MLSILVGPSRRGFRGFFRFLLAVAYVGALTLVETRTEATLPVLYVPIITLAAATASRVGIAVCIAAVATSRITLGLEAGPAAVFDQSILPAVVVGFLAYGTRLIVASLERSRDRLRRTVAVDRRRARRMAALEELGRVLATEGTNAAGLEAVVDVIRDSFGYRYPSIYLLEDERLRMGAQRGYEDPILEMGLDVGIIGRVARTRAAVFLPDVSVDPDYAVGDPSIVSEIGLPLIAGDELLGVLNVESDAKRRLDDGDFAAMRVVADHLATSLALGRERQRLRERADLLGRLTASSAQLGATLDRAEVPGVIASVALATITSDAAVVTLSDGSGGYLISAIRGGPELLVGRRIEPGEGAAGRAISERRTVIVDAFDRDALASTTKDALADETIRVMAVPIDVDRGIEGAITFTRCDGAGFSSQEREIAQLLASQAGLALANASLHGAAMEAAVRDPLTALHNRRFLDDTLARARAARFRLAAAERRPVAAIMFDLDHFGALNKRYGHRTGDAVLRGFADLLARRFRASDLVARYGGEEFLVVLEGATRDDAVRAAEQIREAFADLVIPVPGDGTVSATVSAGCSGVDASVDDLMTLLEVADVGLAMAKSGGRNQVVAA